MLHDSSHLHIVIPFCIVYIFMVSIIQIYSVITRGRVLNGELNAQRLQNLIYLNLFKVHFMKISLHSSKNHEPCLQTNSDKLTSLIFVYGKVYNYIY